MTEDERRAENDKINAQAQDPCFNPAVQVYFRAGLLACREIMARFVEQGGNPEIANSIRANWFPVRIGPDPGAPRLLNWQEIADERPDGHIAHKPLDPSVEALPLAYAFINNNG